jgi:hypothetical protein
MKRYLLACALGVLGLSVGCNRGVKAPVEGRLDPYSPSQIHMADEDLRAHMAIGRPIVERDPAGLLRVTVPVRSASDYNLYVDYRVTFFDQNGAPIGQPTGWASKRLERNVPDNLTLTSTTPAAADFEVDFRYAR